jgi:DNA polymerase-3 subunit gamma/tau
VSPDAHTPAERADAVLRAAEAAAAAAQAAAAAAQAASLPAPEPPPSPEPAAAPEPEPEPEPPEPPAAPEPPIHQAGAPARLLAAASELEANVAQARAQLDALQDALARVERADEAAE